MSDTKTDEEYYGDGVDELYRPFLIHPSVYMILTEEILTLMPKQRNVILSMNSYEMRSLNPLHPNTLEAPTHVTIFCIRLIASHIFQPIGAIMTYKYHNQCAMLGECLKAYINDLWKLGLHVVATVSPPFQVFKDVIGHVVKIEDINGYSDVISYDVDIVRNIIHIYDIKYLFIRFQMVLRSYNLHFIEDISNDKKEFEASWADISTVLSSYRQFRVLNDMLNDPGEISRKVHAFTEPLLDCYLEAQSHGQLSSKAEGCAILLRHLRSVLRVFENDLLETSKTDYDDCWIDFTELLKTVQLKPIIEICTKEKKSDLPLKENNPSIRRKIDFSDGSGGTRKNDLESRENKHSKKSKNKNNKKKKHVDKKTEPRKMCKIPENEKSQSLVKIQEMCASLKDDRSYKDVIESQVFERVNEIPSGSFHTTDISDIHDGEFNFDNEYDPERNYNSDESVNDSNNKENIDINVTSDYKIICSPNKFLHLKSKETDDSNNESCDTIPDKKKSTVDNIETKNFINESCEMPDIKRSPESNFEIKNSSNERFEILDIKKSSKDNVEKKYSVNESCNNIPDIEKSPKDNVAICEIADMKKSRQGNFEIENSCNERCGILDMKKSSEDDFEKSNSINESCTEIPSIKKSSEGNVEIENGIIERCEILDMTKSSEDDVEKNNSINESCQKIPNIEKSTEDVAINEMPDIKKSPEGNVEIKNIINESCEMPDIKKSPELDVEIKNLINEICEMPDIKRSPEDTVGIKNSINESCEIPDIKKSPKLDVEIKNLINASCEMLDIKRSPKDNVEIKNSINKSSEIPDTKKSPKINVEIKHIMYKSCEMPDMKKSPKIDVEIKNLINESCEMPDIERSPEDNVEIMNSINESSEIPDTKKSPKVNVQIKKIMYESCEMPDEKSPKIDVEIKNIINESCEKPDTERSPDLEVKNSINESCNKISDIKKSPEGVENKNSNIESFNIPDMKRSSEDDVENKNSINETCDRIPDVKRSLEDNVESKTSISKSCGLLDIKTPPDDNGGDKYSLDKRSDKTPGMKRPPKDVKNENDPPAVPKDPVFNEMRSMILGMKKLLKLLPSRRVRHIYPGAFTVEHAEYFVKMIREKNLLPSIRYHGQNFEFMNSELAFATLKNDSGLYLLIP